MYGYLGLLGGAAVVGTLAHLYLSANLRQRNNELASALDIAQESNRLLVEKNERVFHNVAHTLAENESAMRAFAIGNGYYGEHYSNPASFVQQQPIPEQPPMLYNHSYTLQTSNPRTIYHSCTNPDCQWDCSTSVYQTLMAAFAEEDRENQAQETHVQEDYYSPAFAQQQVEDWPQQPESVAADDAVLVSEPVRTSQDKYSAMRAALAGC
ncbi:hypothetical protein [Conchiformibius steedae]|uniref:hypothetical protein n=1 Tax=Conchiformibius steedae TaxID=153493 RepID=UPI0026EC06E9|nr:hypothetical protein [Conchiformibius steedae]